MGLNAVLNQHRQVFGRKGRSQLQDGIFRRPAQKGSIIIHWGERGGEKDGSHAASQRLPEQPGRIQTKQSHFHVGRVFNEGHEVLVVKFSGAPERVQFEIEHEQGFAKPGRLVFNQPALGRFQRGFEWLD